MYWKVLLIEMKEAIKAMGDEIVLLSSVVEAAQAEIQREMDGLALLTTPCSEDELFTLWVFVLE